MEMLARWHALGRPVLAHHVRDGSAAVAHAVEEVACMIDDRIELAFTVTRCSLPIRAAWTISQAKRKRRSLRCRLPTWNTRPVCWTTFERSFPSSIESVGGFSQYTSFP